MVVSKSTPMKLDYNMTANRVTLSVFIQRYTEDGFAIDTQLQKIMNDK